METRSDEELENDGRLHPDPVIREQALYSLIQRRGVQDRPEQLVEPDEGDRTRLLLEGGEFGQQELLVGERVALGPAERDVLQIVSARIRQRVEGRGRVWLSSSGRVRRVGEMPPPGALIGRP